MSAIIVTLFLGGPAGPIGPGPDQLWPIFWFLLKLLVFLSIFVLARGTLPRFRYDQLMDLGWKRLIPAALLWLLFIATLQIGRDQDWDWPIVVGASVATGVLVTLLIGGALRVAGLRREQNDAELGEVAA
jgi:NADH-quinone oxidoreductase subunit H